MSKRILRHRQADRSSNHGRYGIHPTHQPVNSSTRHHAPRFGCPFRARRDKTAFPRVNPGLSFPGPLGRKTDAKQIRWCNMKKALLILTALASLTIARYSQANKNDDDPVDHTRGSWANMRAHLMSCELAVQNDLAGDVHVDVDQRKLRQDVKALSAAFSRFGDETP